MGRFGAAPGQGKAQILGLIPSPKRFTLQDTLVVTSYNALNASQWKGHFENLPRQVKKEGTHPKVPRLYNFKLDFRFK